MSDYEPKCKNSLPIIFDDNMPVTNLTPKIVNRVNNNTEDLKNLYDETESQAEDIETLQEDLEGKIDVPQAAGTAGQVLTSDGEGGVVWASVGAGEVVVDPTLSVAGAAADAKVTGDEITAIKTDLGKVNEAFNETNNIIPVLDSFPNTGKILGSSGQLNDNSSFSTSDYLPAGSAVKYLLTRNSGNVVVCSYTQDKTFITGSQQIISASVNNFTTPANTAYIRVSVTTVSVENAIICPFDEGYVIYGEEAYKQIRYVGRFDNKLNACNLVPYVIEGGYISAVDGSFVASTSFAFSPMLKTAGHKSLIVTSGQAFLSFYNSSKTIIPGTNTSYTSDYTKVDIPSNAEYFRICVKTANMTDFINGNVGVYYYNDYIDAIRAGITNAPRFDNEYSLPNQIGALTVGGYYKSTDGGFESNSSWAYSNLIELPDGLDHVTLYKVSFACWYNSSKTLIPSTAASYNDAPTKVAIPANAKYLRVSALISNDGGTILGNHAVYFGTPLGTEIHVGSGYEYTTLRSAFEAAFAKENVTVYVHPGTYNLVTEFADKIATFTGDAGLYIGHGMHVIFYDGAKVTANFDVSGYTAEQKLWVLIHFQPIFTHSSDFTIEGLDIEATDTRYCVHDELAGTGTYVHKYLNCRMKYTRTYSTGQENNLTQCIGGGLGLHGTIVINGGYFKSVRPNGQETNDQICVSYHNGNAEGCDSSVFIKNVYLADRGFFQFGCYGSTQDKSQVYISGCGYALPPNSGLQNSSAQYYNMEVTAFANEQRVTGVHWEFDENEPWKYELVSD